MSNYLTMVKLLISYMFRRDKSKQKSQKWVYGIYAVLGVTYLIVAAFVVFMISLYSTIFINANLINEFVTLILIAGMVFVLIFGIIAMLSNLYFSRDTEFFMTLPVKPGTVYMAKLTVIYLTELITSSLFLIPCLITLGVVAGLSPLYYVVMFFAVLLTPAIPLFLASVLSIPIMYVVSFFKRRGAAGSIAVILLFGLLFALYYVIIMQFMNTPDMAGVELTEAMRRGFIAISNIFYPLYALVKFASFTPAFGLGVGASMAINLGIFVLTIAVFGAAAFFISNLVYRKAASSQLEGAKSKANAAVGYTASGALKALMKKEWNEMIRTPAFAFQCLSGTVLCPIILAFMNVMNKSAASLDPSAAGIASTMMFFVNVILISFIGIGMNIGANTSITREGEHFYYAKLLPVPYKTQIKAKSYVYLLTSSITIILSLALTAIFNFNIWNLLAAFVFLMVYNYGYVHFAILFDLSKPKLDWVTPNEATKNSRNATVPMLLNMAASAVMMVLTFMALIFIPGIWAPVAAWGVLIVIALTAAIVFSTLLYKNCDRMFYRLG